MNSGALSLKISDLLYSFLISKNISFNYDDENIKIKHISKAWIYTDLNI